MAVLHLTKENFDASIAEGKVIVDFWATLCGPCRMQAPILEQFDAQMGGNVKVCKVDVDEQPELAKRFGIFSIPTLIAFNNGAQTEKRVGVQTAEQLAEMLG